MSRFDDEFFEYKVRVFTGMRMHGGLFGELFLNVIEIEVESWFFVVPGGLGHGLNFNFLLFFRGSLNFVAILK